MTTNLIQIARIASVASVLSGCLAFLPVTSSWAADFATKCQGPGVIMCWDFDDPDQFFYNWDTGSTVCSTVMGNLGFTRYNSFKDRHSPANMFAVENNGGCHYPEYDSTIRHSGAGSMKFTIPGNTSANVGFANNVFGKLGDGSIGSGEFHYFAPDSPDGNIVYMQFYQRFSSDFLTTDFQCTGGGCGGWKQLIWYGNPPNGSSSSSIEVTHNNGWQRNVPQLYGQQGSDDYGVQDVRGCSYNFQPGATSGAGSRQFYTEPPCIRYKVDQWMEFTVRVEVRGAPNEPASRVQMWVDGDLAVDYGNAKINWGSSDGDGLGQMQITPYHTNKDSSQSHPTGYTWYDDVIVSTQPILMKGGSDDPDPPAAPTNLHIQG